MNLQGKIPTQAKKIAEDMIIETGWQKYVVYDGLITLALAIQDVYILPFDERDQVHDSHKSTALKLEGDPAMAFRRKYRIRKNADFFRHAMHHGTSLMQSYMRGYAITGVTSDRVFETFSEIIGTNAHFKDGLARLHAMRPETK